MVVMLGATTPEGVRTIEIVSLAAHYFPELGTDLGKIMDFLWEFSPYPFVANLEAYRRNFERLKRTWDAGLRACDLCPDPVDGDDTMCASCRAALSKRGK